jgi:uncharacterized UBP type Zn finger protein
LLHLKRFIFVEKPLPAIENLSPNEPSPSVEYIFGKNKSPVIISKTLSLDKFQSTPSTSSYSIQSIVHHWGRRASSGHYTADVVRTVDGVPTWVTFDDAVSTYTSLEKITASPNKQSTAYMVMYALDSDASSSTA